MSTEQVHARDEVRAALRRVTGCGATAWNAVTGGCSPAGRARVDLENGRTVFAKWATEERTATYLREEWRVYDALRGDFMPKVYGFVEDLPLLVIEDLGRFHWPPPWTLDQARRAAQTLRRVHASDAPKGVGSLASYRDEFSGWQRVQADPAPFLSLGLASASWLDAAIPALIDAEAALELAGDDLLHFDARGDNLCFADDGRVVLIDWNWACVGNGVMDTASLAVSIHADGGPRPEEVCDDNGPAAAAFAGYWASRAGLPGIEGAPTVRALQRHCLRAAFPWAARLLRLTPPA